MEVFSAGTGESYAHNAEAGDDEDGSQGRILPTGPNSRCTTLVSAWAVTGLGNCSAGDAADKSQHGVNEQESIPAGNMPERTVFYHCPVVADPTGPNIIQGNDDAESQSGNGVHGLIPVQKSGGNGLYGPVPPFGRSAVALEGIRRQAAKVSTIRTIKMGQKIFPSRSVSFSGRRATTRARAKRPGNRSRRKRCRLRVLTHERGTAISKEVLAVRGMVGRGRWPDRIPP